MISSRGHLPTATPFVIVVLFDEVLLVSRQHARAWAERGHYLYDASGSGIELVNFQPGEHHLVESRNPLHPVVDRNFDARAPMGPRMLEQLANIEAIRHAHLTAAKPASSLRPLKSPITESDVTGKQKENHKCGRKKHARSDKAKGKAKEHKKSKHLLTEQGEASPRTSQPWPLNPARHNIADWCNLLREARGQRYLAYDDAGRNHGVAVQQGEQFLYMSSIQPHTNQKQAFELVATSLPISLTITVLNHKSRSPTFRQVGFIIWATHLRWQQRCPRQTMLVLRSLHHQASIFRAHSDQGLVRVRM